MEQVHLPSVVVGARVFFGVRRFLPIMSLVALATTQAAFAQTCTNLCLQQTSCSGSKTTSISGTVYAPNGTDPLPNVLVYVPNSTVEPFNPGVACEQAGEPASGSPLVSTTTATDGTFTLTNMPVGSNIPLVIQAGRWRRQVLIPAVPSCVNTPVSASLTHMPTSHAQGDIPLIAIATGAVDSFECVFLKMGIAQTEFTNPGGGGRINLFLGAGDNGLGGGARINSSTPSETTLESVPATLNQYDLVMFPCQGAEYQQQSALQTNVIDYANLGGRIFATHFSYVWLFNDAPFSSTAYWDVNKVAEFRNDPENATIDLSFPKGLQLAQWMKLLYPASTLGQVSINTLRRDQDGVVAPTQSYLTIPVSESSYGSPSVMQFTFNTPVGASAANQCGRVLFNEYHVEDANNNNGMVFPAECPGGIMTPQEKLLEFSLFDLSNAVSPDLPPTITVGFTPDPFVVTQGDGSDNVTINVANTNTATATNPSLTFTAVLPAGLTAEQLLGTSASTGWICTVGTLTCTRTTGLNGGASDPIELVVSVSSSAPLGTAASISGTVSGGGQAASVTNTEPVTVHGLATITWNTPAPITYGTLLSTAQLDATASVPGNFAYGQAIGALLTAGQQQLSVTFTPNDTTDYPADPTATVELQVNQAVPQIAWSPLGPITYGTLLSSAQLDATSSVPGTFNYNPPATTLLTAGVQSLTASFIPSDSVDYTSPSVNVPLTVNQAVPLLTWASPAAINNATPLSTTQLDATASVPGTFNYNPALGTVLDAGSQTLSVTFAPNDAVDYTSPSTSVPLTVTAEPGVYGPPTTPVGSTSAVQTADVNFTASGTLGTISLLSLGAQNLDYTLVPGGTCAIGTAYSAGQACSVMYTFTPVAPGQRPGAVALVDSTGAITLGTSLIAGTGTGPAIAFDPAAVNTLGGGFNYPEGVAVDGNGDVFVADNLNSAVKEIVAVNGSIPPNPIINTLGGGFDHPTDVAVDGSGNVFVADQENSMVKEILAVNGTVPANPTINTLGSGFRFPNGIAVDGSGNVFVADTSNGAVKEILAVNGTIPANPTINTLGSGFGRPTGVAVDGSGNVFVADAGNNAVYEILAVNGSIPANPTINTLGSGFKSPGSVAVDASGDVLVADTGNSVIKEILPVNGSIPASPTINTLGSGFSYPNGLAVDGSGNVFVADTFNSAVKEIQRSQPPSVSFGSLNDGSTSTQSFTAQNIGNTPLTAVVPGIGGLTTGQYTQVTGGGTPADCTASFSLPPAAECNVSLQFAPVTPASGPYPDTYLLTDNDLNASSATQTINVTGTASDQSKTINFPAPASPVLVNSQAVLTATASNGDPVTYSVISGAASISGSTITYTTVGSVTIEADSVATASTAAAPPVMQYVTVNQIPQTITFTAPTSPVTYGVAPIALAASGGASGNPVTFSILTGAAYGSLSGTNNSILTITGAGSITIAANQLGNTDYSGATQVTQQVVVNQAAPTINFSVASQVYGTAPFAVSATSNSTGTITYSRVSGPVTVVGNMVTITGAGQVVLQASQAASGNYSAGTQNASFGVSQAVLTVLPVPQNNAPTITVGYGNAMPTLSFFYGITGFVNGDTAAVVSGQPALSVAFGSSSPAVGAYPFTIGVGTLSAANYTFITQNGTVYVVPAAIVVKPNATTTKYGTAPTLSYVVTGLKYGQTASVFSSAPIVTTTATTRSPVGNYPISVNINGITSPNYTLTAGPNAALAVTPVNLQVKALSTSMTYGASLPALTYAISGFVNNDTASVVSGTPQITTTASTSSPAGAYPIAAAVAGMTATNYIFSPGPNAVLTVYPAVLTVAAQPVTIAHGSAIPALTYKVTGFVNSDPSTVVTGAPILTTTATKSSPVGTYPINITAGTLAATNYTFKLTASTLTIH